MVFHVLNRGNQRQQLFGLWQDYRTFMNLLRDAAARSRVRVLGYCLMPNHWHLLLWPETDASLSVAIHHICTQHALTYRRRSKTVGAGHLYQNRFRSFAVETSGYYFNVLRYVEANAARAGLVRRAEQWFWSSARERAEGTPDLVVPGPLPLPANWLSLVNQRVSSGELDSLRTSAHRQRPYGPTEWVEDVAGQLHVTGSLRSRGRPPLEAKASNGDVGVLSP